MEFEIVFLPVETVTNEVKPVDGGGPTNSNPVKTCNSGRSGMVG